MPQTKILKWLLSINFFFIFLSQFTPKASPRENIIESENEQLILFITKLN